MIEAMRDLGIDLSGRRLRRLTVEMQLHADWAVTMGCGDACPYVPTRVDDWDIPDPAHQSLEVVREIRDEGMRTPEEIRACADAILADYDDANVRSFVTAIVNKRARECLRAEECAALSGA